MTHHWQGKKHILCLWAWFVGETFRMWILADIARIEYLSLINPLASYFSRTQTLWGRSTSTGGRALGNLGMNTRHPIVHFGFVYTNHEMSAPHFNGGMIHPAIDQSQRAQSLHHAISRLHNVEKWKWNKSGPNNVQLRINCNMISR